MIKVIAAVLLFACFAGCNKSIQDHTATNTANAERQVLQARDINIFIESQVQQM